MAEALRQFGEELSRQHDGRLPEERVQALCDGLLHLIDDISGKGWRKEKKDLQEGECVHRLRRELADQNAKVAAHENTFMVYMTEREKGKIRGLFLRDVSVRSRIELCNTTCAALAFGAWQTAVTKLRSERVAEAVTLKLRADAFASKAATLTRGLDHQGAALVAQGFNLWVRAMRSSTVDVLTARLGSAEQQAAMIREARARALAMFEKTVNGNSKLIVKTCFHNWVQLAETNKDLAVERGRLKRTSDIGRRMVLRLRGRNLLRLSIVRWYMKAFS